jgi:hypothetical protein
MNLMIIKNRIWKGSLKNIKKGVPWISIEMPDDAFRIRISFKLINIKRIDFKYYIKEAGSTYNQPFFETKNDYNFDVQLNLFAFKRK